MSKTAFIVHGWAYETAKWQPFMDELQKDGIEVKLLHVPGLTTEPLKESWTLEDYLSWLDTQIGTEPATLICHSNGGRIALNFAARHPERIEKLILIDSAGVPDRTVKAKVKRTVFKVAAKVGKQVTKSTKARRLLYRVAREQDYMNANPVMRETMANLLRSDYSLDPTRVQVPTYMIWGRDDGMTPLRDAKELQKAIKGSKLKIIDGARHSPQFTHFDQVADAVVGVIKNGNL